MWYIRFSEDSSGEVSEEHEGEVAVDGDLGELLEAFYVSGGVLD